MLAVSYQKPVCLSSGVECPRWKRIAGREFCYHVQGLVYNVQCVGVSQLDALHLAQGAWLGLLGVDVVLHEVLEARLPTRRTRRQLLVLCIIHCVCRLEINELIIALWMFSRASQMEFTRFQVPNESSKVKPILLIQDE